MRDFAYFKFNRVKIDNLGYHDIHEMISKHIKGKGYICCAEATNVMSASVDPEFLDAMNNSLINVADGMPLVWYGKLLGSKKIERVTAPDLLEKLLEERNGFKHYLLGDTELTLSKIIEKAKKNNDEVRVVGHSPPFKDNFNEEDNKEMLEKINEQNPDIVWVSFGGRKQEKWMHQNIHKLNRGLMIGVGAAFRYYTGDIFTPPKMFQYLGMQWLFRIIGKAANRHNIKKKMKSINIRLKFLTVFPVELIRERKIIKKCARQQNL